MSLDAKRQEFADALDTLGDVTGNIRKPPAARPGDAWPVWQGVSRDDGSQLFLNNWAVVIMTPQSESGADEWIAAHIEDLHDAIEPVAYVQGFAPANIGAAGQQVYGLIITTRSE